MGKSRLGKRFGRPPPQVHKFDKEAGGRKGVVDVNDAVHLGANLDGADGLQATAAKRVKTTEQLRDSTTATDVRRLIVVLEDAQLETAKIGHDFTILSSDKHANFIRKMGRDPSDYRPDITHQCLLMLMDSPLNRAGMLRVYIHTRTNVLIEIAPHTRIPRTYDRFAGLMVQLLHKLCIRADDSSQKLLKIVKNPISMHLPVGCVKLGTSFAAPSLTRVEEIVPTAKDTPIVVVVGAIAKGKLNLDYTEGEVKISNYPLSAALTCAKLTHVFEVEWAIETVGTQ